MTNPNWQKPTGVIENVERLQSLTKQLREALHDDARKAIETLKKMAEIEVQRQNSKASPRG